MNNLRLDSSEANSHCLHPIMKIPVLAGFEFWIVSSSERNQKIPMKASGRFKEASPSIRFPLTCFALNPETPPCGHLRDDERFMFNQHVPAFVYQRPRQNHIRIDQQDSSRR